MNINSAEPVVSVIIPMYKVEDYLRECLDSAVNQTLKNIEIICVDDGSPDRSAEIAEEYAAKYSSVKVLRKENGGQSSARNLALDIAAGRYVYFLDSDDFLEPNTLEELCAKADAEELDIVYFNTVSFFENQEIEARNQNYLSYYNRQGDYSGVHTGQKMFAMMRKNKEFFGSPCLEIFRRSLVEENNIRFYRGIIHEDNLFTFQCTMLAKRVGYIDKAYYHRRVHDESTMTTNKSMRNVEGYLVCYAEMLSFMHERDVEPEAAQQISEYLYYSIYRNACNIYMGLNLPDEETAMAHGDFTADHLLDLVKRNNKIEKDRDRLKKENEKLRQKIRAIENNAKAAAASGRKNALMVIPRKIKGFFQCIRDHGLGYTIRYGFSKLWGKVKTFDQNHSNNKFYRFLSWPFHKVKSIAKTMRNYGATYHFRAWFVKMLMKTRPDHPFVSIIMPVYNAGEFLEQGLDTLLNQTLRNIEIIAVDDGSQDNSLEILNRYAAADQRVKVLHQQNKFAGAARNLGLDNARGEYVIFLDSDDFFAKNLCEEAYFAAKVHKADVVLFGAKHYNNATGKYREASWLLQNYLAPEKQPFTYRDCPDVFYRITSPAPWTKMFRREFVESAGLRFQTLHNSNDLFFTYSAMAMAERIATVNKSLVYYRVGLDSNLQTKKKRHPFCFYEAYTAWYDKLRELGALDIVRRSYVNVALSGCLHNLRTNNDPESKKQVFDKLKYEAFEKLEISGHEESYYYMRNNYKDMKMILDHSFEEYMEAQQ